MQYPIQFYLIIENYALSRLFRSSRFLKLCRYISFTAIYMKGNNFCDFLFAISCNEILSKKGSTLEGKNLLKEEQIILTFKN